MPYDGNGNASLNPGYFVQNGDDVLPSQHNPPLEDIVSMLSQVLLRNGVAPLSGNLNANGNKIINLATPTNPNDAARLTDIPVKIAFRANKNGVNQLISTALPTKVTFTTEVFDKGGYYDAATSRFTPPAGVYTFSAALSKKDSGAYVPAIEIRKNGVAIARGYGSTEASVTGGAQVSVPDEASGTDYYEVYVVGNVDTSIANYTVLGLAIGTWFAATN